MTARSRRRHGGPYSTTASEAPCEHCRRPLIYAWDDGLRVRVDAQKLDPVVADTLRGVGRRVYALTAGRQLVYESAERAGSLRTVHSRHPEHLCTRAPADHTRTTQLAIFDLERARPAPGTGGLW